MNLAFEDSVELAAAILQILASSPSPSPEHLDASIRSFESTMFVRAAKTAQMTCDMKDAMFTPGGGPRKNIERYLLRAAIDEIGWLATCLVAPFVYSYYFAFRCIW